MRGTHRRRRGLFVGSAVAWQRWIHARAECAHHLPTWLAATDIAAVVPGDAVCGRLVGLDGARFGSCALPFVDEACIRARHLAAIAIGLVHRVARGPDALYLVRSAPAHTERYIE